MREKETSVIFIEKVNMIEPQVVLSVSLYAGYMTKKQLNMETWHLLILFNIIILYQAIAQIGLPKKRVPIA
jgi:hypothetical protein